jgi:hypothetical protein
VKTLRSFFYDFFHYIDFQLQNVPISRDLRFTLNKLQNGSVAT